MDSEFFIPGNPADIVAALFPRNQQGHVQFGEQGVSREQAKLAELESGGVEIVDTLPQGEVSYGVSVEKLSAGVRVKLAKHGTPRDQFIDWSTEKYIRSKGYSVASSETTLHAKNLKPQTTIDDERWRPSAATEAAALKGDRPKPKAENPYESPTAASLAGSAKSRSKARTLLLGMVLVLLSIPAAAIAGFGTCLATAEIGARAFGRNELETSVSVGLPLGGLVGMVVFVVLLMLIKRRVRK